MSSASERVDGLARVDVLRKTGERDSARGEGGGVEGRDCEYGAML